MAKTFVLTAKVRLLPPNSTDIKIVAATIRAGLKGINTNINLQISKPALAQLQKINRSLSTTKKKAQQAGNAMEQFGEQSALAIRRFAAFTFVTAGFFAFSFALRSAFKNAIDFERQLVKVAQVTNRPISSLKNLKNEITRLSTVLGVSSTQLAETSRILSQTGLSANEVKIALGALAKTELAPTFADINKTTEASIALMAQFGIGVDDLESKLGAINAVAGKFAVEAENIGVTIRRTGGVFAAAGGDMEELIGIFTAIRSTTRESSESIATGLRTITTRLQRVRTGNFLRNFGINLRDKEGQFVGVFEAFKRLSTALNDIPSTDPRIAQITEELGGFRQVGKLIPAIKNFSC